MLTAPASDAESRERVLHLREHLRKHRQPIAPSESQEQLVVFRSRNVLAIEPGLFQGACPDHRSWMHQAIIEPQSSNNPGMVRGSPIAKQARSLRIDEIDE